MKPLIASFALLLGTAGFAPAATAGQVCMDADEMKAALIDWYGERPVAEPSENNELIWASKETGSWTMIKTLADGNACVIAQGDDWLAGPDATQMLAQLGN
ncbi:MAG: S-adenosyl-L-homocysteine hydrolase [Sulfitobacter sp.]|nr:S-adenosyl-L-homocysteine hydrolase [Sulfitobacter sp.]